jgi:hypothetical protein
LTARNSAMHGPSRIDLAAIGGFCSKTGAHLQDRARTGSDF